MTIVFMLFVILATLLHGDAYSADMLMRGFGRFVTATMYAITSIAAREGKVTWK